MEKAKITLLILVISIGLGLASKYKWEANLPQSLVIGLYTTILGILVAFYFGFQKYRQDHFSKLGQFSNISKALLEIERVRSPNRWAEGTSILTLFEDNLDLWRKRICEISDRDQVELWLAILRLYLLEEGKDLGASSLSTNVDIYARLLMQTISYHIDSYGKDAVIVILTSLLPIEWYQWPSADAFERERVYSYRKSLKQYIEDHSNKGIKPDLRRYIITSKESACFKKSSDLFADEVYLKRYIDDLHFRDSDALYFEVENLGDVFPKDYRDVLFFGKCDKKGITWRWAVESNMDPGFPVMFVKFYDCKTVNDPATFCGYDVCTFVNAIHGISEPLIQRIQSQKISDIAEEANGS